MCLRAQLLFIGICFTVVTAKEKCSPDWCVEGENGICSQDMRRCICTSNYYGDQCQYQSPTCDECPEGESCNLRGKCTACRFHPCSDHGQCQSSSAGVQCACDQGWFGAGCDKTLASCSPDWCVEGVNGQCTWGHGRCICSEEYYGRNCQNRSVECSSCPEGEACNLRGKCDACKFYPCSGHGSCQSFSNGIGCLCEQGWNNNDCSNDMSDTGKDDEQDSQEENNDGDESGDDENGDDDSGDNDDDHDDDSGDTDDDNNNNDSDSGDNDNDSGDNDYDSGDNDDDNGNDNSGDYDDGSGDNNNIHDNDNSNGRHEQHSHGSHDSRHGSRDSSHGSNSDNDSVTEDDSVTEETTTFSSGAAQLIQFCSSSGLYLVTVRTIITALF